MTNKNGPIRRRNKYSEETKERVRNEYPYCTTLAEKIELAKSLNMDSLHKLYNLASRLGITGTNIQDDLHIGFKSSAEADNEPRCTLAETNFTTADDNYLKNHWGNTKLSMIAAQRGHSEPALLYRARTLGLRRLQPQWNVNDIARYLGIALEEIMNNEALHIMETKRGNNTEVHYLVSTISLYNWLRDRKMEYADEFFLLEITESYEAITELRERWESCKFLTPYHMCANPNSSSYGLYCARKGNQDAGEDPKCKSRTEPLNRHKPLTETVSETITKSLPMIPLNKGQCS